MAIVPVPVKVNPWRADLQRARFRSAFFHVEGSAIDTGRRTVVHEFPKRNIPYAEDMGRRVYEFTVRGYCICYPSDEDPELMDGSLLYQKDYRIARDLLAKELVSGEPGRLYLPTFSNFNAGTEMIVMCPRYRLSEEEKLGGFCTFDMTFVELGSAPIDPGPDSRSELLRQWDAQRENTINSLDSFSDRFGTWDSAP
jgi:hypothetical protein